MRKLISLIIIVAIIALGIGIFLGWQKVKPFLKPPTTPTPTAEEVLKQKLKILSDKEVFDYWVKTSTTSTEIFYITPDGKIFKAGEGINEEISASPINHLQQIKSLYDGSKILIQSGTTASSSFIIFDLQTKIWQPLGPNISAADFAPNEQKIIYLTNTKTGVSDLIIKNLAAKTKQTTVKIMSLNQKDFDIAWIDKDSILLIPKPSAQTKGEVWKINFNNQTIQLFTAGDGLMLNWQKNKHQGLKTMIAKKQLISSLINQSGQEKILNFATFPNKCDLSELPQVYCAIFITDYLSLPSLNLPDDYLKKAVYVKDNIYKIDVNNLSALPEEILSTTEKMPFDVVKLSKVGNALLFINRYDGKLYALGLEN